MFTVENEYYLRFILLLCDGCSYITKKIIDKELSKSGEELDVVLKRNARKLHHEFHKKQTEKLFPNNGYDKTNIDTWDIQMLVGVLLLIFRQTLSDKEKEKLKEIKEIRNNILAHSPNATLSREKYEDFQKQIRNAIKELASGLNSSVRIKCDGFISAFASGPFDISSAIKCSEELKATDEKLQQIIDSSQDTRQDMTERLKSLSNQIKRLDENQLKGMDIILKKFEDIKIELDKQRKSTDRQKELPNADGDMQTVKVLEDKIDQKIKSCNKKIDRDVRRSFQPYDRYSGGEPQSSNRSSVNNEEIIYYRSSNDYEAGASNSPSKAVLPEPTYDKPFVVRFDKSPAGNCRFVAAIDIGTSFSGYAFSEVDAGVHIPHWYINSRAILSKTSNTILFNPDKEFHSFGFDAENQYVELVEDDEHMDWYYFQHFKMQLYTKQLTRTTELEAESGKKMDAKEVFSATIRYFHDEMIKKVHERKITIYEADVDWVLTVPAIWTDSAKQFMRECAIEADIPSSRFSLALESESAAVCCQYGYLEDGTKSNPLTLTGTKYIVLDMGGGTVDTTVCENGNNMTIKVLHKASGGAWGGIGIDKEFAKFITGLIGQEVYSELCKRNKLEDLELQREFEVKKRTITSKSTNMITFSVSGLFESFKDKTGKDFKEIVDESAYGKKLSYKKGKLYIDAQIMKTFFAPCCENVVRHISDTLETNHGKGIDILLLTGGLSKSELMQNAVSKAFPNLKVLVPEEPEVAVLRGALIYAANPSIITERVINKTYGVEITPLFDPSVHPESMRVSVNGQDRCKNVFKKFVGIGETVKTDQVCCHEVATIFPYQKKMCIDIYASSNSNPMFVDDADSILLGSLRTELQPREKGVFNVKLIFGETEISVISVDLQNFKEYACNVNFLG